MPGSMNSIQTRQGFEELFGTKLPLTPPSTFVTPAKEVAGYDSIAVLAVSDVAFEIQIQEACSFDGEYAVTQTLASAVTPDGFQAICERIQPCGAFMKMTAVPGAPQGAFSFCSYGIPAP